MCVCVCVCLRGGAKSEAQDGVGGGEIEARCNTEAEHVTEEEADTGTDASGVDNVGANSCTNAGT